MKYIVLLLFFFTSIFSEPVSFYYWRTSFFLTEYEKKYLDSLKTKTIYLRLFDLGLESGKVNPLGLIQFKENFPSELNIVPVIFIKNVVWENQSISSIQELVAKVNKKVNSILKNKKFSEIQFDSDWTEKTKENYFYFLKEYKKLNPKTNISSTIRLHQVKYFSKTGIPEVDEYYLMFYNMGNLNSPLNSIYNLADASKYIASIKNYPKKLNLILPLFSWLIHSRENRIQNIISKYDLLIKENELKKNNHNFTVTKDFIYNSILFKSNDKLKLEEINMENFEELVQVIAKEWTNRNSKILLFDINENNFKRNPNEQIKKILNLLD
jgi:hypothetical protein